MHLRIAIERILLGEEPRKPRLYEIDIEEQSKAVDSPGNEDSGTFRVEATARTKSGAADIVTFGIQSVNRTNFLETAIECLCVLHSSNPSADERVTMPASRSESERTRFSALFDPTVLNSGEDDETVILLTGGITRIDQAPVHLPVSSLVTTTLIQSNPSGIDEILNVAFTHIRITIEWIQAGDESPKPRLYQIDIEDRCNATGLSENDDSGEFRVEAADHTNTAAVDIVTFGIESIGRKNFLEAVIECLRVLHSTNPSADERVTMLVERSESERSHFNSLFDFPNSSGSNEDDAMILLPGGGMKVDQTPVHLQVAPSIANNLIRSHQPSIDEILDGPGTLEVVDDPWVGIDKSKLPIPWGWFVLIILVFGGALLWSLLKVNSADERAKQIEVSTKIELIDEEQKEREAVAIIDQIDASVRKYFSCKSVEELIPLVRHAERVAPLMRDHYKNQKVFIGNVDSIEILRPLIIDMKTNFWMVGAILSNGHHPLATVEIMDSGEARVDWESLVCHQPMDWTEYAQKRPAGSTMDFRVYAEPDNFHSHEFANPEEWLSVRLTAFESIEPLFGYARIDSPEALQIRKVLRLNKLQKTNLILRLKIPEGLQSPRGVLIEKLVSPRWIYVNPPASGP